MLNNDLTAVNGGMPLLLRAWTECGEHFFFFSIITFYLFLIFLVTYLLTFQQVFLAIPAIKKL